MTIVLILMVYLLLSFFLVVQVLVRMILHGQAVVSFLDLWLSGIRCDTQNIIKFSFYLRNGELKLNWSLKVSYLSPFVVHGLARLAP